MSEKQTYEPSPKALEELATATAPTTARTSINTSSQSESLRENARQANPNGFSSTSDGVNVQAAEAEFATLQRELSGISQASRKLSRTQSRKSVPGEKDVEKTASDGSTTEEEPFDLEHVLRGNHTVSIVFSVILSRARSKEWERKFTIANMREHFGLAITCVPYVASGHSAEHYLDVFGTHC